MIVYERDRERELFLELKVCIVERIFKLDYNKEPTMRVRELNKRDLYDWVIPYAGESIDYNTKLLSKTPSQAFHDLAFLRPDIIKNGKNEEFKIYVRPYKNNKRGN